MCRPRTAFISMQKPSKCTEAFTTTWCEVYGAQDRIKSFLGVNCAILAYDHPLWCLCQKIHKKTFI